MKRISSILATLAFAVIAQAQTMNVNMGQVTHAYRASQTGQMPFTAGQTLTIGETSYPTAAISSITIDQTAVADNTVSVAYSGTTAHVTVSGNIAHWITATVNGAHVAITQSEAYDGATLGEITYTLSGTSQNGSFWMDGSYKASFVFDGLTLHNPDSAAVNIRDGKRISLYMADGTDNALSDGTGGEQKAALVVKGHTELKGGGTLTLTGGSSHAFWGKEYLEVKKTLGALYINGAAGDGIHVNQYFQMNGGTVTIQGIAGDGIQVDFKTDDNDQVETDDENTGEALIKGGTLTITTTGDGVKGVKAAGNYTQQGGEVTVTQTGAVDTSGSDLDYCAAIRAKGDIAIAGGKITVRSTANGGRGLNADGAIIIDENVATTTLDIEANGNGGTAEAQGTSGDTTEPAKSYRIYVSLPTSTGGGGPGGGGGSQAWKTLYLYKADGTLVQTLTQTVTKSSGYSNVTFYYYDFGAADSGTYYFKSDNYTSRSGWGGGTTYTIVSATFSGPTSGEDIYYSITNSYTTSGTTRTYSLTNVTSQYGGTSDLSEDTGTSYNASGIKADGNVTIEAGTVGVKNSGAMSKSIKSKATVTINGGDINLKPSGAMMVINNDASYSSGVKTVSFVMNEGTLTITPTGVAGKGISATTITTNGGTLTITSSSGSQNAGTNDAYTAKAMKADGNMALNAGNITLSMTGTGGKGIKVNGAYTQGRSDGTGPTLNISTTGTAAGTSSGGGGWGGGGGKQDYYGCAKAIKVMGAVNVYGGTTDIYTKNGGSEGLESKTGINIAGGMHYFKCEDDCMNSSGPIVFNGGTTVCWSTGNDAVDSNSTAAGAITIGNGNILAYTTKGGAEEGLDCDNNSRIRITGNGTAISAGGSQGGGSSNNTISGASQGYSFVTSSVSYSANTYYTLQDSQKNNIATFCFPQTVSSNLSLFTAKAMKSGTTYYVCYNSTNAEPTDATTAFHGFYLGSTSSGSSQRTTLTAK